MRLRMFHKVFLLFLLLSILPLVVVGTRITLLNYRTLEHISQEMNTSMELFLPMFERTLQEGVTYSLYVIIIVVIVAIFFTASIVGPIERLRRAAQRMSEGDYSSVPEIKTGDELEDLARAFGEMAEKLERTMKELELAHNQKRVFLDIMCHDLSNYLSIIGGFTSLLMEEERSKERREVLEVINKNVRRMEEVLDNARRLARLERGTALELRERDIRELLLVVKELFSQNGEAERIRLELPEEEVTAEVDEIVEDVFLNLISNALKYSKDEVVVRAELRGDRVRVSVSDYGPGIPDEHKQTIFERFWRLDRGGVKGTGLGLAIAKSIVELHGGRIWVEDNSPRGSVFIVELPRRHAD
ncbi:MAG: HAMP domain-containing histidine kinase [Euryarchaeota archaeon]|nr:HAMP domain-containing histidine kinase [Euryarchaeota archaeon]